MKICPVFRTLLLGIFCGAQQGSSFASVSTSTNYSMTTGSLDGGGESTASASYAANGSVGAIGGIASVTSPAETMKSGFIGQLYQVTGLALNTNFVDNGTPQQLLATQTLDDGTTMVLLSSSQSWSVVAGQLPAGLILNAATGVISGTPTGSSGYSFTILVIDGLGNSARQTFSMLPETFAQWEAQFPQLTDLSQNATPLHDGVDNLLKYLFDINPTEPMARTDRAALPNVGIDSTSTPGTPYLELTYRQNQMLENVTVNVQTSTDLQNWTTVNPPNLTQQVGTDPSTGDPFIEVGVFIQPHTSKKFIRLNVTSP